MDGFEQGVLLALLIVLICIAIGIMMLWRKVHQLHSQNDTDLLARLYVYTEREAAQRRNEVERTHHRLADMERSVLGRLDQGRVENIEKLGVLSAELMKEQAEARVAQATALREMAEQGARQLADIRHSVTAHLHEAVEKQMQTSFNRVLEQFGAMQKAMGEVTAVTAQIGDLRRLFSNVKTRGGWGEAQLRSILDDILPAGSYFENCRLSEQSGQNVEFALKMPLHSSGQAPLLAIDAKFPTEAYERLLNAQEESDSEAERVARKALEAVMRAEAKKIASKYILPPQTVDYAILYLPTDGLYAEIAHIPGLIDEIGRVYHVIVMSPGLVPALLRTIALGHVSLALEEKTALISKLLGATRQEMVKMDGVLEKLARNSAAMSNSIDEARRRTRVVAKKLNSVAHEMQDEDEEEAQLLPS